MTNTVITPTSPASDTKRKRRASTVVVEEEKELHVPAKKGEKRVYECKEVEAEPEMKAAAMDLDEQQQQQQNLEEGQEAATLPALPTTLTHSLQLRSCYAQPISLPATLDLL